MGRTSARWQKAIPEGPGFSPAVNPAPKGASALPKAGAKPEGRSDPIIASVFALVLAFAFNFGHFLQKNHKLHRKKSTYFFGQYSSRSRVCRVSIGTATPLI
jgi:hypothetical protein